MVKLDGAVDNWKLKDLKQNLRKKKTNVHCLKSITAKQLTAEAMYYPDLPDSSFRKAINRNQFTANRRQICRLAKAQVPSGQDTCVS